MGKWHDEVHGGGSYISTKTGCDITLTVKDIVKITDKPEYEPKTKDNETQGFVFEFVGEEGTVTASTFALQSALKNADVGIGDTIKITHPEHGIYIVTKV